MPLRDLEQSVSATGSSVPGVGISASPANLAVAPGSPSNANITVTSLKGFSGEVSLSITTPAGLAGSSNPNSVDLIPGSSATAALTVFSTNCVLGNYTVTITGTSGTASNSTSLPVKVISDHSDPSGWSSWFVACANVASLTMTQGSSATATITVAGVNGFGGEVWVSPITGTLPIECNTAPGALNLTTTVTSASSTLECSSSSPGNYTVGVTALWNQYPQCNDCGNDQIWWSTNVTFIVTDPPSSLEGAGGSRRMLK